MTSNIFPADASVPCHFSPDRRHRYTLMRQFDGGESTVLFVMLNPSTADETQDDPTVRRCISFAQRNWFSRMIVCNIFALRSTDPRALYASDLIDAIGPENDEYLDRSARAANQIICAWGTHGALHNRGQEVASILRATGKPLHVLRLTAQGHPAHPLYLPNSLVPEVWEGTV